MKEWVATYQKAHPDGSYPSAREIYQRHAGAVTAQAEIGCLSEREAAGEPEHDVEAHGRDRVDEDFGAEGRLIGAMWLALITLPLS